MMNRPTFSDVYDINPKTGALILGKNRLDDYATKFLNKYCKKALDTPMPLPRPVSNIPGSSSLPLFAA